MCRSLQPPAGDQKVLQTDDLRREIISVATNCFHPISSLMSLFKVFSLCLLSDSTDPNVTAHSKQVSPPWWVLQGYVIQMLVAFFIEELQNDIGRHKDATEALLTACAARCVFQRSTAVVTESDVFEEIKVVRETSTMTKAVQWNASLSLVKLKVVLLHWRTCAHVVPTHCRGEANSKDPCKHSSHSTTSQRQNRKKTAQALTLTEGKLSLLLKKEKRKKESYA